MLLVTEKKGMDAWKVSFECQNRSDGYENTHRKATGSTKYEPKTAPERSQGHLQQQEASKRGPREFQDESGSPLWSIQRPQRAPQGTPRDPNRSPREPQNAFKTIVGSKTLIVQKYQVFLIQSTFRRVGWSVWEFKIDPKRPREEIKLRHRSTKK